MKEMTPISTNISSPSVVMLLEKPLFRLHAKLNNRPACVYVAGPYTKGDLMENVRKVIDAADKLIEAGYAPFIPHTMTMLWHLCHHHGVQTWYELDNVFLKICDAVLRVPGESAGSDAEVRLAYLHDIPVFHSIAALRSYFESPTATEVWDG